jgi:hypothetical protein
MKAAASGGDYKQERVKSATLADKFKDIK